MTRTALASSGRWAAAVLAACVAGCAGKPTEEACEKAVANIRKVTGQTQTDIGADQRAAVRSCRAQSSRDTVDCYASAQSETELVSCGGALAEVLRKRHENRRASESSSGTGSGSPSGPGSSSASGTGAASGSGARSESGSGQ